MSGNHLSIHHTVTSRITERGSGEWEFYCNKCEYHALYWERSQPGHSKLEILNTGDPGARHTSNPPAFSAEESSLKSVLDFTEAAPENPNADFDEENWLTPELRTQLEKILQALEEK